MRTECLAEDHTLARTENREDALWETMGLSGEG